MYALITGASSGIGKELAKKYANDNYDLILVARRIELLEELKKELNVNVIIKNFDLSIEENAYKLYEETKNLDIEVLVNNAGVGDYALFEEASLDKQIFMTKLNDITPIILTKLYLNNFIKKNSGHIINICSVASFYPGPLMNTYYATKSYLYNFSLGLREELKRNKRNIYVSVICPGPTKTEFEKNANFEFGFKPQSAIKVVDYSYKKLKRHKVIIIPSFAHRVVKFLSRFVSDKMKAKIIYKAQRTKK